MTRPGRAPWLADVGVGMLTALGILLVIARIAAPFIPFLTVNGNPVTLGQAHALCSSLLGGIAQAASPTAATDCGNITLAYDGLNVVLAAAIACFTAAGWVYARSAKRELREQEFTPAQRRENNG